MARVESRLPPQNLDAEQSVLGSILLDNEVFARIEGSIRAEHFYKEGHRKIFRGMERLFRQGEPIDLVTLTEELRRSGELDSVGSVPYLIGLADSVPTAAYAENYARIVAEKALLRELIARSGTIMQTAYDAAMPVEQILDKAEAAIFEMGSLRGSKDFLGMGELVSDTFAYINELFANPDPVSGLRTGFKELDQLTAGLQPSSLNVLAARPSMGKTALALSIAQNVALREAKPVGVFSLEMSGVQLVTRMLCSEARVDMSRVRNGQLSDRDFQRLADTAGRMSEAKIFIDDNADMTVMELRSRARRLISEHGPGLIVIDYLQLMSGGSSENRQQEISNISRGLKALARELDVPVLVLSQLSRAVESRPNKRPMLSDLRECVTGDTLVALADGRRVPIARLVGTQPEVLAVDAVGKLVRARSDKVWKVGARVVFEVRLASGRRIRATAKHRLLTEDGWRRVGELAKGTRLATARRLPEPVYPERWPDSRVALLGQLIGDAGQRSYDERIPEEVFRLANDQVALLLSHLWAAGGCIEPGKPGEQAIFYAANCSGLAYDVAALLLRFGIHARIQGVRNEGYPAGYRVRVAGSTHQKLFLQSVGSFGLHRVAAQEMSAKLEHIDVNPTVDALPRQGPTDTALAMAKISRPLEARVRGLVKTERSRLVTPTLAVAASQPTTSKDQHVAQVAESDLFWDEFVERSEVGTELVYDLTVPGMANWCADNIISHNSGAIEQDADLVMFIYRDEYYDPNSEKQGIAEVIIGKQRNGPVGSVDLQFHNAHVRFNDLARTSG